MGSKGKHGTEGDTRLLVRKLTSLWSQNLSLSNGKKRKTFLETLVALTPLLSNVVIAGAVAIATWRYNESQLKIAQIAALDKYRTYLVSERAEERVFGYEAFVALGQQEFVTKLIAARADPAGSQVLEYIAKSGESKPIRDAAEKALLEVSQEYRVYSIVNLWEFGITEPDFEQIITFGGDLGYGALSLRAGTLEPLIRHYCESDSTIYGEELSAFSERLAAKDLTLVDDENFKDLLRKAGRDPAMRVSHFQYFRENFFSRAYEEAIKLGINAPLGIAVIYDSVVQGGWPKLKNETTESLGGTPAEGIDEHAWLLTYLERRIAWMEERGMPRFTLRPESMRKLALDGNWNLVPPLEIGRAIVSD